MHTISLQPDFFMPHLTNSRSTKQLTEDILLFSFYVGTESYLCLPSDCSTLFFWKTTTWNCQIYQSMTTPLFLPVQNATVFCLRFFTPDHTLNETKMQTALDAFNHSTCYNLSDFTRLYHKFLNTCLTRRTLHPILHSVLEEVYLRDGCLTIKEAAAFCGYSERHLIRLFQNEFQCRPKEYFNLLRFLRALNNIYILPANKNSMFIEKLNYCDQAHFQNDFKKYTTMTPRQFIKSLTKKLYGTTP